MKCPKCGYNDEVAQLISNNVMSEYVNPTSGKTVCVVRSEEKELVQKIGDKEITLLRKDLWKAPVNKPVVPSAPVASKTPQPPVTPKPAVQAEKPEARDNAE